MISKGRGLSYFQRPHKLIGITLVFLLLAVLFLNFILSTTLAGTETGEFCPTCPDWTDLDGWLAKKEAYERAQLNVGKESKETNSNPAANPNAKAPKESYVAPELLISVADLKGDWVILDVRAPEDYESGHIPGARSFYWKEMQKSGILDPALAVDKLSLAGVNNSDRLLICGGSDEGAFFVFWALCYLGKNSVSLLDGGVDAAWAAGYAPDKVIPPVNPSNVSVDIVPWLLVTPGNLQSFFSLADLQILDARDFSNYGRNRLNSSMQLDANSLYGSAEIKDAAALKELFDRRRLDDAGTQIVYGTPQAYKLFYGLKLMGYNATMLEGDWWKDTEWAVSDVR
jgi:thiosulfate/3-mercaptopyruvate sulfurtransferase